MRRLSIFVLCAAGAVFGVRGASLSARRVAEISRPPEPEGLSSVTWLGGERFLATEDRAGTLYELTVPISDDGKAVSCAVVRGVRLQGRTDTEGCAWDPLERRVWVVDERDSHIRQFDPTNGQETARVAVPEVYLKNRVHNRALESLTISPDGLKMYTANEETLKCDGEQSNRKHGASVRIQEFVRGGAGDPWRPTRQFRYRTDPVVGAPFKKRSMSGVSGLVALEGDVLLVLEREMSMKNPLFPSFRASVYAVQLGMDAEPAKHLVWQENTMFANYEGICLGPKLADGSRILVLVSDGGGEAVEHLLTLDLRLAWR